MSSLNCKSFRAHHLRPDKCRNCFGDKSRHQEASEQEAAPEAAPEATREQEDADEQLTREQLKSELRKCRSQRQEESNKCLSELEESKQLAEKYKSEIDKLKAELQQVQGRQTDDDKTGKGCEQCARLGEDLGRLRADLARLERERDEARDEARNLEREMEELQDNFKEEESDQFEMLKQELDSAMKNCKILQIRLNKADRQYSQLEQVKSLLERQLEEASSGRRQVARQVSSGEPSGQLAGGEHEQLVRDLKDSIEREKDLQEQVKYSEEEAQLKSERLAAVEAENEVLLSRVNKLTLANSRLRAGERVAAAADPSSSQLIEQSEQLKLALDLAQSECERLRAKLQVSEARERALREGERRRAEREASGKDPAAGEPQASSGRQSRAGEHSAGRLSSSQSFDSPADARELNRKLRDQCDQLSAQKSQLERKLELLSINENVGSTLMESDLLEKLKQQLDSSESELAKARARLVELDLEHGRLQRQHRRLLDSLKGGELEPVRRSKLPSESQRDAMSRQELRQALRELETELDESLASLRAKNCLLKEQQQPAGSPTGPNLEEQVKSLRRLLEQERLLSSNLKIDVSNLEQARQELQTSQRMYERERAAMEEEVDKLRQVNGELNVNLEELRKAHRTISIRWKELQSAHEKVRVELAQLRTVSQQQAGKAEDSEAKAGASGDLLLMARDLSELKVKNGFLMRQLEIAREEAARQLDDLRKASEAQQRRAVELAQLELKERQLVEGQQVRDELNELKQKLAVSQRQLARHEEEMTGQRDRLRSVERDWRRDKSQWQQRMEQAEAQLAIEKRSNEFKVKECEAQVREKERQQISVQDRYVQLERDLQRTQNKYRLLEENAESKQKGLERELEAKKRELGELVARSQSREYEYYENCKRFNAEKGTLTEALESIRRSYDEKLAELKSTRELLSLRQDQAYKERSAAQERIDSLTGQLIKMGEHEAQARLLKQQVQTLDRQLESARRDSAQLKEDRSKTKARADELEKRVNQYEKQELMAKTSSISASGNGLFRRPFAGSPAAKKPLEPAKASRAEVGPGEPGEDGERLRSQALMVERLSSKINDQRHLINMLKQQHDETQLELKQLKLVQSLERNRWQSRLALLTSQLNECEEKLLFESSLLSPETFENARRKLEVKWSDERKSANELLRQQQAQLDGLVRDHKKLSQAHDLLRLHSKQLESHNNKLSRKLIEYQQQPSQLLDSRRPTELGDRKLEACLSEKQELAAKQAKLQRSHARLLRLMREETQPLVETVAKIIAALDQGESAGKAAGPEGDSRSSQATPLSDAESRSSTKRPLVTAGGPAARPSDEFEPTATDLIATARPAHQTVGQQPSRLTRLLLGRPAAAAEPAAGDKQPARATKTVKRVKVKASSLGITTSEKRLLKQHLNELSSALEDLGGELMASGEPAGDARKAGGAARLELRASSEVPDPRESLPEARTARAASHSHAPTSDSESPASRVRWQLDNSDLDSERSWSASHLDTPASTHSDLYRRFPKATPSSGYRSGGGGVSLTDCGSESSLASDFSYGPQRRFVSGTESDGCVQSAAGSARKLKATNRKGLKVRLTNTWRNIGRSITALASDSESESAAPSAKVTRAATPAQLREVRV